MTSPEARKNVAAPASTSPPPRRRSGWRSPHSSRCWCIYFIGMDQGATSVFGNNTVHPRVRARRPPPARLPLPLTRAEQPTQWKSRSSGAACWPAPSPACSRSSSRGFSSSPSSTGRSASRTASAPRTRPWQVQRRPRARRRGRCSPAACRPTSAWASACCAFSVAMGALFAVVFAVAYGRVGNVSARLLSVYVAGRNAGEPVRRSCAEVPAEPARASASTRRSGSAPCCTC